MEWRKIEESKPNDDTGYRVLVFANDIVSSWIEIVSYSHGRFYKNGFVYPPIVTHWMPLPEPPKD